MCKIRNLQRLVCSGKNTYLMEVFMISDIQKVIYIKSFNTNLVITISRPRFSLDFKSCLKSNNQGLIIFN